MKVKFIFLQFISDKLRGTIDPNLRPVSLPVTDLVKKEKEELKEETGNNQFRFNRCEGPEAKMIVGVLTKMYSCNYANPYVVKTLTSQ